jgi:nickel-dependent lactate racemase
MQIEHEWRLVAMADNFSIFRRIALCSLPYFGGKANRYLPVITITRYNMHALQPNHPHPPTMTSATQPPPPANSKSSGNLFCSIGSPTTVISNDAQRQYIESFLASLGERHDVLILPPDYTRFHSNAGCITQQIAEYYNFIPRENTAGNINNELDAESQPPSPAASSTTSPFSPKIQIIPALGTHAPMTRSQIQSMFGNELANKQDDPFIVHNWREDVVTIGYVPADLVSEATYGMVKESWPAQLNKLVWEKRIQRGDVNDTTTTPSPNPLILSVGQVVPHEVLGMANFNKNLFVGVGGVEAINLSHFIGAVHGMEKLMGRGHNPLRSILNYASEHYLKENFDLWYILTVMGTNEFTGKVEMRGLYIGNDVQCYDDACELSLHVNFNLLDKSPTKIVVYLNEEYHSTWLGNKAIYRTRMAIANGGELIVLAPHVSAFGEDGHIDELIRAVGYVGTPAIMEAMKTNEELKQNLSAVAHLIHGSSEGRFSITYCPGKLSKEEIESVGFQFADLNVMMDRFDIHRLKDGWNTEINEDGIVEEFYYVGNPALGLWAVPGRFEDVSETSSSTPSQNDERADNYSNGNQRASEMSGGVGGWKQPPPQG